MRTIAEAGHAELTVQRSRFIAALAPAGTQDEARAVIAAVRKTHHAARHHATAFILGATAATRRCNDDGEPAGTAGAPMLAVLAGAGLTDTVAVVTRYFGGVKLGTGGLARAYGGAVSHALDVIGTAAIVHAATVTVTIAHAHAARLEAAVRAAGLRVDGTDYDTHAHLRLVVDDTDTARALIAETAPAARFTITGTTTYTTRD